MSIPVATPGKTRIGWIGTGVMGRWMCEHAMKKGFAATVYNRSADKARPLVDQGAKLDVRNVLGWTPLTIANGVMYSNFYKSQRHTAALLVKLMRERGIDANDDLDITGAGYVKDVKPLTNEVTLEPAAKKK